MAVEDSGTLLDTGHTLGVETILATVSPTGVEFLQLEVDISALNNDEEVTLRIKTKTLAGGAQGTKFVETYSSQQAAIEPLITPPPFMFDQDAVFSLEQNNGIKRSFPWKAISPG